MGLPGRLLEISFSPFSLCSHSCIHTQFLSRCVLNRYAAFNFLVFSENTAWPFPDKANNQAHQTAQRNWDCKNTGAALLSRSFASFIPHSAQAGYSGWIMSLFLGLWVTAAAWISGFILGSIKAKVTMTNLKIIYWNITPWQDNLGEPSLSLRDQEKKQTNVRNQRKILKLKCCALCWKLILNCAWGKEGSEYCFDLQMEDHNIGLWIWP